MAAEPHSQPSFSPYRKWSIGFHVGLLLCLVLGVVVMVNYLSQEYFFLRLHLSAHTRAPLSTRTVKFLESLTNQVKVIVYYDKDDPLYSTITDLLKEYKQVNPRLSLQVVDYLRDAGPAQKVKADYKLATATDKNLVIFDGGQGRVKVVEGNSLAQYTLERVPDKEKSMRRKLVAFQGERIFTGTLLAVTSAKPLKAYFLTGHGEHRIDSNDELSGYMKFVSVLEQNYIQVEPLSLLGTNPVPADCHLLVVAGPTAALPEIELRKIEQYLNEGGRLLALFNYESKDKETGLERILAKWGVRVGNNVVVDPDHTISGAEVIVSAFSRHPLVNPLLGSGLYMLRPRTISRLPLRASSADAPRVEEIAFTGPRAYLAGEPGHMQRLPLMVAVEKGAVKNVITERGTTRMVVAGDSLFLGNHQLDLLANRDFASCAVNWLLDRPQLVEGVGPRPVDEYRVIMTKTQLQSTQWILLAGMPGGVLLLGGLVWLRRRR